MGHYYFKIFLMLFFAGLSKLNAQLSVTKNTSNVEICSCPGAVWDLLTPFTPSVSFSATGDSKRIMFSDYQFNIPNNAIINGIQVDFTYSVSSTSSNAIKESLVSLLSPVMTPIQDKTSLPPLSFTTGSGSAAYGGPTDTWGTSWSPFDINSSAFGFNFRINAALAPADFTFQNGASITVYYSIPTGLSTMPSPSARIKTRIENRNLIIETGSAESVTVEVFEITGKKILSASVEGSNKMLGLSEIPNGFYLYRIKSDKDLKTAKFLLD